MDIRISKNGNHIVFIEQGFNELGFAEAGTTKIGAVAFDKDQYETAEDALEVAKTLEWTFADEPNAAGIYDMTGRPKSSTKKGKKS